MIIGMLIILLGSITIGSISSFIIRGFLEEKPSSTFRIKRNIQDNGAFVYELYKFNLIFKYKIYSTLELEDCLKRKKKELNIYKKYMKNKKDKKWLTNDDIMIEEL